MNTPDVPLYHQIYLVLREQIAEGQFADGRLPAETEFTRQFGASRITMRKALDRLVEEGVITRHRRAGTFVKRQPQERKDIQRVGGLLEDIISHGLRSKARVIEIDDIKAPVEIAALLELPAGASVTKAIRVRSYAGEPLSHMTTYVPQAIAQSLPKAKLDKKPMLTLIEEAGVRIGNASQTLSARLADSKVAPLLGINVGAALLFVQRVVRDVENKPVQLLRGLYRPDRYEYRMELSRVEGDHAKVWISAEHATDLAKG